MIFGGCTTESVTPAPDKPVLVGSGPLRIGILFPPSPSGGTEDRKELTYARDMVNGLGGVAGGRRLEFVTKIYTPSDLVEKAQAFIDDPDIVAVVGPALSADVQAVAPLFTSAAKVMISPMSTSDEVLRAFGGGGSSGAPSSLTLRSRSCWSRTPGRCAPRPSRW